MSALNTYLLYRYKCNKLCVYIIYDIHTLANVPVLSFTSCVGMSCVMSTLYCTLPSYTSSYHTTHLPPPSLHPPTGHPHPQTPHQHMTPVRSSTTPITYSTCIAAAPLLMKQLCFFHFSLSPLPQLLLVNHMTVTLGSPYPWTATRYSSTSHLLSRQSSRL